MRLGAIGLAWLVGCASNVLPQSTSAPPIATANPDGRQQAMVGQGIPVIAANDNEPRANDDKPAASPTNERPRPLLSEPTPQLLTILPDELPEFARLDFVPDSLPHRSRIRRQGELYAPSSLSPLTEGVVSHAAYFAVKVIDPDKGGQPRRPRVLCESSTTRVAVAVDAKDLAMATRSNVFVRPAADASADVGPATPGLRLAGGTEVAQGRTADGMTELSYSGLFLRAGGYVDSDALDVVFVPDELPDDDRRDGEITRSLQFFDAPEGTEIGRVGKDPTTGNTLLVRRLGARDGHTLVRYQERDALIVGWVASDGIRAFPLRRFNRGRGGGGSSTGRATDTLTLVRGTVFVPSDSTEVIGVVTQDYEPRCTAECDGPHPLVRVHVCGRSLSLRAVAPITNSKPK